MVDVALVLRSLPPLLAALAVTLQAAVLGMALALVVGLAFALLQQLRIRWMASTTRAFVDGIRNTPLLVQLYFLFYVLPDAGLRMSPLATGILGLGLHYSAYTAEIYRAGLQGVPRGQWEAAAALHFGSWQTLTCVVLPQAIPPIVPALGNRFIALLKDTPMLSAITVVELMQRAKIIGAESFRYLEPITLVGIVFLVVSAICALGVRALEQRTSLQT